MFTNSLINRAVVSYSSEDTGQIKVRIPSKFESNVVLDVSFIGRKPNQATNVWSVPAVGEQVVVATDGDDYANVFILNVNPSSSVDNDQVIFSGQIF